MMYKRLSAIWRNCAKWRIWEDDWWNEMDSGEAGI